jgi:hypothetical protein
LLATGAAAVASGALDAAGIEAGSQPIASSAPMMLFNFVGRLAADMPGICKSNCQP